MNRYTMSVQLYYDVDEVDRRNFWVEAESFEDAVPFLENQLKQAWASLRIRELEAESDKKPQ